MQTKKHSVNTKKQDCFQALTKWAINNRVVPTETTRQQTGQPTEQPTGQQTGQQQTI
jgi:hypothetical protein